MGFIRGTAITFFSIVLLLSLFLMNVCLILSWSLEHDTFQPALKASASDFFKNSLNLDIENVLQEQASTLMKSYCLVKSEYTLTYENYSLTIPCEVIEKGTPSIIDYGLNSLIDKIYYAEYNCEFWKCIKETSIPFVLFSEKAMDYWRSKFILLAVISFVLFVLIFLVSKTKSIAFIIAGSLLVLSALPFGKLNLILTFIPKKFAGIFSVFFTKSHNVFIIIFIIGLIFIGIGFVFRFFGWSMNFTNWFSKDSDKEEISKSEVREIVDEEIAKKKSKSKKKKQKS